MHNSATDMSDQERDPTSDWPPPGVSCPRLVVERHALELSGQQIAIGDRVEKARFLGRPDERFFSGDSARIGYPNWGLTLEFEEGGLVRVTFDLDRPPANQPDNPFASTQVKGPDGLALTQETTARDVRERFGEPTSTEESDGETLLYERDGLVSAFSVGDEGRLFAWDVYLDEADLAD